ncbi:RNA/RNP complex-1-interacting phosphatase homolog isoform X1 [Vanessa atalanta]|uniref:RNA/RNP complex-1-interacting phosphatase homolog isoform X1 n=1 Tax=Vanessa atalanta TaxID=42275 RepID=UPI001FCE1E0B|nr:RNA/RNP complex-1-interacting phosphatase homolog isoform X1 [Vanessa atalanta]
MVGSIPDRWIPYKALGKVIDGTRIICFKVPLHKRVQKSNIVAVKDVWDIKTLLKAIPKLGAVIDLTNTAKYYDPAELKSKGVLYKKILIPGRQLPSEHTVNVFMDTVDEFLKINDDWLIGVHCTHGLNRTGYMVCRYLRDRVGIPAKDAIKSFEIARGYQIERANFIADLLGKTPPPPDLGKETVVKPVENVYQIEHSLSPISINKEPKLHVRDNTHSWCVPSPKKKRRERSISKSSTSSYEFDYKYDY